MNFLNFLGLLIFGIEGFKWIFITLSILSIIVLVISGIIGFQSFFIGAARDLIILIVFSFLGFPVVGIIITQLIVGIVSTVGSGIAMGSDEDFLASFIVSIIGLLFSIIGTILIFAVIL